MKGAVSEQKALQMSEMEIRELLEGTEENSVTPMRGHFTKRKQKIELVARPDTRGPHAVPGLGGPEHVLGEVLFEECICHDG